MSVWFAIPSKRPPEQAEPILKLWRERGYKIALWRDMGEHTIDADLQCGLPGPYPGYGAAVNALCRSILLMDSEAEWIVTGGDDVEPDLAHSAKEIAYECSRHFWRLFGVMQPTGDRWGDDPWSHQRWPDAPAYIDRICGSPWLGRDFCRRMYGGRGPFFEGYRHMYVDEELQNVAQRLGVLWQRRDLTHHHRHWGRKPGATQADIPEFLREANDAESWKHAQQLFESRRDAGFPGHEPIP